MTNQQKDAIQNLQLTSDIFFSFVLNDIPACQEVVRIITGEDLNITEVRYQETILQLVTHSIRIDIWAKDSLGRSIGIEMHPQSNENRVKRNRYNIASIDTRILNAGSKYSDISDTWGIYITKADFLHTKRGINKVVRFIDKTNHRIPNGTSEYYVCLSCQGDSPAQTALLQYMKNSDGITESEYFPNLVKRVRFLKEEQGGHDIMCEIIDKIIEESVVEAEKKAERRGKKIGRKIGERHGKKIGERHGKKIGERHGMELGQKSTTQGMVRALKHLNIPSDEILNQLMIQLGYSKEEAMKFL